MGLPQNECFTMEKPIKLDDLGVPHFRNPSYGWKWPKPSWLCGSRNLHRSSTLTKAHIDDFLAACRAPAFSSKLHRVISWSPATWKRNLGNSRQECNFSLRKTGEDLGTSYLEDEKNDDISIKYVYVCVCIYIYTHTSPRGGRLPEVSFTLGLVQFFEGCFGGYLGFL